jgi:tetratricopeptide (TPR) repeat protein
MTTFGLASLLALTVLTSGCEFTKKVIAKDKLNQGAILYNGGKIKEAEGYFREAAELIPNNPIAWLYYGSTVYKRFQNASGDEQKQLGQQALDIFKKAFELSPESECKTRDSAMGYLASVYDELKDDDNNRMWTLKRAEGSCADKASRAITYYSVGVRYWRCSYDQTSRYADKTNITDAFHYRNMDYPAALPDKEKAMKCADDGLKYVEQALAENPEYVDAMFYKALLYRQKQMLTKEEPKRKEMADMAQKITDQATALGKKIEAEQKAKEAEAAAAAAAKQG